MIGLSLVLILDFFITENDELMMSLQDMIASPKNGAKRLQSNPPNILRRQRKRRNSLNPLNDDNLENEMVSLTIFWICVCDF